MSKAFEGTKEKSSVYREKTRYVEGATGVAIAILFFVESFGTREGLGYYILVESWGRLEYPEMYAGVVAMAMLGLSLYYVLDGMERRICRWTRVGQR